MMGSNISLAGDTVCAKGLLCQNFRHLDAYVSLGLAAVWSCVLAFDIMVYGLTLHRAITARPIPPNSVFAIMLRDGERE